MGDKAGKKIWGMKRSTRWIVGGVLLTLVLIGGFFLVRNRNRSEQLRTDYDTRRLERGDLISVIGATGNIRARQSAVLTWRTSGTVENVYVSLGDQVEEGETLAVLEQTSLPRILFRLRQNWSTPSRPWRMCAIQIFSMRGRCRR